MSPESHQKRSELSDFVLEYCLQMGAIVDPPAYGVYNVLLPDNAAAKLGAAPLQRFVFKEEDPQDTSGETAFLHYGHPFVDRVVEAVREQSSSAQLFINDVRLTKRGLFNLAQETLSIANARLFEVGGAVESLAIYHYVRFNFKASLITDEKRELILPVWMHLQGGYTVDGEEIEQRASLDVETTFKNLERAAPTWLHAAGEVSKTSAPLDIWDKATLSALVERARQAALERLMAGSLEILQRRARRYLELDRARLEQYYTDLQRDLNERFQRASDERRSTLEDRLASVAREHQSKLADVEEKYRLHVDLELFNLLTIAQPKVALPVAIKNRSTTALRQVVWDPLLHRLEPLVCDVCGKADYNLWLCEGKHLAHADCLMPQCVDCKRAHCRLCSDKMKACAVCGRPVCVSSLNHCSSCGRGTCIEHVEMCHTDDGKPAVIQVIVPEPEPAPAQAAEPPASISEKTTEKTRSGGVAKKVSLTQKRANAKSVGAVKKPKQLKALRIEVYSEMTTPLITAYVIAKNKEMAARHWELASNGVRVSCRCEKYYCRENGILLRPETADRIEAQIREEIRFLREEYQVPAKGVQVYRVVRGQPQHERKLMLFGLWKDSEFLARSQVGYDEVKDSA